MYVTLAALGNCSNNLSESGKRLKILHAMSPQWEIFLKRFLARYWIVCYLIFLSDQMCSQKLLETLDR